MPGDRFTDRVDDYARHRPGYPRGVIAHIVEVTGLSAEWIVADVGSGTGLSSLPFLNQGNRVHAVEPNAAMRSAAEAWLGTRPGFTSVDGSAEATGLGSASVDLVVVGQAFHWFDRDATRKEFARILRRPGWVALFWNTRITAGDPFSEGYERLLERFGTDYAAVRHDRIDPGAIQRFFTGDAELFVLPNEQTLDLEGLRGRLLSSSYTPAEGDATRPAMLDALDALHSTTHDGGYVRMRYETQLWVGSLHGQS